MSKLKKINLRRAGLLGALFIFLVSTAMTILPHQAAKAQVWPDGSWNIHRIVSINDINIRFLSSSRLVLTIDGRDYHFEDINPFDSTYQFRSVSDGQCFTSTITFDSLGTTGFLSTNVRFRFYRVIQEQDSTRCALQTFEGRMNRLDPAGYRFFDAFLIDEDNIFMPIYRGYRGCGDTSHRSWRYGVFRRYPRDTVGWQSNYYTRYEGGQYDFMPGGSSLPHRGRGVDGFWIQDANPGGSPRSGLQRFEDTCQGVPQTTQGYDIRVAPADASIPGFYQSRYSASGGGAEDEEEEEDSCESRGGPMAWLMCPIVMALDMAMDFVDRQVQGLLSVDTDIFANQGMRNAWANMRNIAYMILVPIMLVMVIGTALGFDFISAYTVKRALPRLVIAALFITLSYQICVFLIEFFNAMGRGILGLMSAPFDVPGNMSLANLFEGYSGLVGVLLSIPQTVFLLAGILLFLYFYGSALLLAIVIGFIVLMARQLFIIALVLVAPLAILSWIFPGNDKIWKSWWSLFSKLLIMFPLIMALIAMGRVFAWIIRGGGGGAGLQLPIVQQLAMITVYIIPYVFIPFTFKFAGGVFGTLTGAIQNKEGGLLNRIKEGRKAKMGRTAERLRLQNVFKGAPAGGLREKINLTSGALMHAGAGGLNPLKWRGRIGSAMGATQEKARAAMQKDEDYATFQHDDNLAGAMARTNNAAELETMLTDLNDRYADRYLNKDGSFKEGGKVNLKRDIEKVERMRKKYGNEVMQETAFLAAAAGGTEWGYGEGTDSAEFLDVAQKLSSRKGYLDNARLANLVAQGKKAAMDAGRVDQGGTGFGDAYRIAQGLHSGKYDVESASKELNSAVLRTQGPGVLMHASMKPKALEKLMPQLKTELKQVHDSGNTMLQQQYAAAISSMFDSAASDSPQKAGIFAREIMNWDPETDMESTTNNMRRRIERMRRSPEAAPYYHAARREFTVQEDVGHQVGGSAVGMGAAGAGPPGPS